MFFLQIEKMHDFLPSCPLLVSVFFLVYSVKWGQGCGGEFWDETQSAACYRRSFPFRWIFKIFPSLCLAVAMPFFSRFAAKRTGEKTFTTKHTKLIKLIRVSARFIFQDISSEDVIYSKQGQNYAKQDGKKNKKTLSYT